MRKPNRTIALLIIAITLPSFAGCTGSDGRQIVTGEVMLDGRPMAGGLINFRPAPGNQANSAGGPIKDGKFNLPANSGLKPGEYIVTVQAFKETGRMIDDPQMGLVPERAPVKFNETGSLEATVVDGEQSNFNFNLTRMP